MNEPLKGLAKALVQAQKEMSKLVKTATNPHLKSKYATLADVNDACLPALNDAGIAVIQGARTAEDANGRMTVGISTTFIHGETGELWREELWLKPIKDDPQGIGSCITYGRRYGLMAMAGLAPDDDDGNGASGITQAATQQAQKKVVATTQEPNGKPITFESVESALDWAVSLGGYSDRGKAQAEYNDLKAQKNPKTAPEMFGYWQTYVNKKVKEAA